MRALRIPVAPRAGARIETASPYQAPASLQGVTSRKRKSECCIAGDPSGRASPDERARRLRYNDLKEVAPVWQGNCFYGVCIRLVLPNGVLALRGSRSVTSSLLPG